MLKFLMHSGHFHCLSNVKDLDDQSTFDIKRSEHFLHETYEWYIILYIILYCILYCKMVYYIILLYVYYSP